MRSFQFRVYDKKKKEWLHDSNHAINLFGETIVMGVITQRRDGSYVRLLDLDNLVAMQYIGIMDINGKMIFEGDIVEDIMGIKGQIKYGSYFDDYYKHNCLGFYCLGKGSMSLEKYRKLKVIGNIYDTSDGSRKEKK